MVNSRQLISQNGILIMLIIFNTSTELV